MKLNWKNWDALREIRHWNRPEWHPHWRKSSVEKLLAARYVEKREDGIWITDAGRAALREHQEGNG